MSGLSFQRIQKALELWRARVNTEHLPLWLGEYLQKDDTVGLPDESVELKL